MIRQPPKFKEALEVLAHHHVNFVVVGGVAAVLEGAPISTFDLDIVHDRSPTNVARLLSALSDLDARYRDLTGRVLRPEARASKAKGTICCSRAADRSTCSATSASGAAIKT
jgi:hypothetical protein